MEVFQAIKSNRSVRQFTGQPLEPAHIERILDAARLSGSAKNRQPWQLVAVTDRAMLQALSECGPWCGHLAGAALGVVLVTNTLLDPPTLTQPFDLGRASQNMILAAWELGIGSCMATIYEQEQARAALGIPADQVVPWAISFGYPDPASDPRQRPPRKQGRKALDEIVHWEHW